MSIRDLRNRARTDLHNAMKIPAAYIAPGAGGAPVPCGIRVHHRTKPFGDMTGFDYAPAERIEDVPEIVALVAEVSPERGGVFSIAPLEAYAVETVMLPDGITVTCQVSRLNDANATGLPLPEDIA